MSGSRKILFIISFLIIDVLLLGGCVLLRNITFRNILENEVMSLAELDLTKDRYNSEVKSYGNYGVVESAIKSYLDGYAVETQRVLEIANNNQLTDILTVSSISKERDAFSKSFQYIDSVRSSFNSDIDLLIKKGSEEEINKYIYTYLNDEEYVDLYHNLLLDSAIIKEINETRLLLDYKKIQVNSYFDSIYNVLIFLKENDNNYIIKNDKIVFNTLSLEIKYKELVEETKRIY